MKKMVVTLALALAAGQVLAATVPELFQKAKAEFAAGKYPAALETLDALKAESDKPENERYRAQLAPALAFYRPICAVVNFGMARRRLLSTARLPG